MEEALDAAESYGLMVNIGYYMNPDLSAYTASNIESWKNKLLSRVHKYKSHRALLMWTLGNEVEANAANSSEMSIYFSAVNELALAIHEEDPNHPVSCALSSASSDKIASVIADAPDLDILSINSYGGISAVRNNLVSSGWTKPYIISEFGPDGTWGLPSSRIKTWGSSGSAIIEETSGQKASVYQDRWTSYIAANAANGCLGGFAFLWDPQKNGDVRSWYSLFTKDGFTTEAVDAMQYCWTGSWPAHRAPSIADRSKLVLNEMTASSSPITLSAGLAYTARVVATSPSGQNLRFKWFYYLKDAVDPDGYIADGITVSNQSGTYRSGTDDYLSEVSVTAPSTPGIYYLFVYAIDDTNRKVATASLPFCVE